MQPQNSIPVKTSNIHPQFPLHPDPALAAEELTITGPQRFWAKTIKTDGCWNWTGQRDRTGAILERGNKGRTIPARRFSWLLHFGPVPPHKKLKNTCGNNFCVRPDHIKVCGSEPRSITPEAIARAVALTEVPIDDPSEQDPTLPEGFSKTFRERFWSKVRKTDACWLWTGAKNEHGYGWIGRGKNQDGNIIASHVASWILHNGPVPEGKEVCHNCPGGDNPACIRPEHLWVGTHQENTQDAREKRLRAGLPHWNSRLSAKTIASIRNLHSCGMTQKEIAAKYGVDQSHVSRIISGDRHTRII